MRINVVDPKYLMDQHLIAEYGEIQNMMLPYYRRSMKSKKPFDWSSVPKRYTLNKGHASFFYNKMGFVVKRFKLVVQEMHNRGFNTNLLELDYSEVHAFNMNDYTVTAVDILHNLKRIESRVDMKPSWYRYKRGQVDHKEMYSNYKKEILRTINGSSDRNFSSDAM
jgi:hypothetical protein